MVVLKRIVNPVLGLLVVSALLASIHPAFAQIVVDPLLEEERRQELERRTNDLGTFERRGGAPDPGPAQARGGPCFQINKLTVEGVTLLSPQELGAILSKYVPKCMQGADIQAVMRELDATYADQGYITSKTYIPPQNLTEGTLVLTMLEGRVEDIFLIDAEKQLEGRRAERQIQTAFPNAKGELFQLRDFEQGLDQMNRLASVDAVLKLQPGEQPGGSYVIVQRLQKDRVRGYFRLDNQGARSTGRNKLSFDLAADDLLGANDTWTLGYNGSENTNALSFTGSIPYGYWTFSSNLSYSEYLTPLNATSELFGTTKYASLTASYMAYRDQISTTELSFKLGTRVADRFINNVQLTPQHLSTFTASVKHIRLGEKARHSYDGALTFGTSLFGADKDASGIGPDIPRAQFFKVTAGWQRQGALGKAGTLVTDVRAQWSPHTLYGSEQMSLGSFSTVRGYEATEATGDIGIYIRNDLYLDGKFWGAFLPQETAAKIASKTQLHLFLDAGLTYDHARHIQQEAAGLGLGFSYYHNRFTASGLIGVPLVENGQLDIGKPILQIRVEVKAW